MEKISRRKIGFQCHHCKQWVVVNTPIGTHHRNHCPFCFFSLHVDVKKPGDRASHCRGSMEPIGLVFKNEGIDRYGKPRQGELMLIHHCLECHDISQNRIAADDDTKKILEVLETSKNLEESLREKIKGKGIKLLEESDRVEIQRQLFGKNSVGMP